MLGEPLCIIRALNGVFLNFSVSNLAFSFKLDLEICDISSPRRRSLCGVFFFFLEIKICWFGYLLQFVHRLSNSAIVTLCINYFNQVRRHQPVNNTVCAACKRLIQKYIDLTISQIKKTFIIIIFIGVLIWKRYV